MFEGKSVLIRQGLPRSMDGFPSFMLFLINEGKQWACQCNYKPNLLQEKLRFKDEKHFRKYYQQAGVKLDPMEGLRAG
jgi:hypothetical protein